MDILNANENVSVDPVLDSYLDGAFGYWKIVLKQDKNTFSNI